MNYKIEFDTKQLEFISNILKEGPYKMVKPILDSISKQVDEQNGFEVKKEDLSDNK